MSSEWEYVIETDCGDVEHNADHELTDEEIDIIVEEEEPGAVITDVNYHTPSGCL